MYFINKRKYVWLPSKSDLLQILFFKWAKTGICFVMQESQNMSLIENSICVNNHTAVTKI